MNCIKRRFPVSFSPSALKLAYDPVNQLLKRLANRAKWPNRGRNLKTITEKLAFSYSRSPTWSPGAARGSEPFAVSISAFPIALAKATS